MDNATTLSNAPTIAPSDSASQTAAANGPPKSKAPKPKRPSKGAIDKDAPPGAVQVPTGKTASGPGSKVVSATIPLSGWGNLDLNTHRVDIEPTFTVDARPFADIVDVSYMSIQSRYSGGGKHIPRSLFRYYCFLLWWYRAIWLVKTNGCVLTQDAKNFLSIMSQMDEFQVPTHIAQYLANMGNFQQGGEQYYFRLMHQNFSDGGEGTVRKGWLKTSDTSVEVNDATFWSYAQLPIPAVMATTITNEADYSSQGPADNNLDTACPTPGEGETTYPTENIIGWDNDCLPPAHNSWRATFSQLGWSLNTLPPDTQTQFLVSTSTLKWVSDRLSTLKDYKVNSIKQLALSSQGHPMLAYYLGMDSPLSQVSQLPAPADAVSNKLCGSKHTPFAVRSRYAIDAKVLAPAFSFGYRMERSLIFKNFKLGLPTYSRNSNHQPWITVKNDLSAIVPLTTAQSARINESITFGSQAFLNTPRFSTHELIRSVGLDAALILSDTR